MKRLLLLTLTCFLFFTCQDPDPDPGFDIIIGDYPGGGNWSDGTSAGFIFNTIASVNIKGERYAIKLDNKHIFKFPELELDIYEVDDDKYYFHIVDNAYYEEAHIGDDNHNYFDFGEDPNYIDPHAKLFLAISSLDPDSAYQLHFLATRNLMLD